MQTQLQAPTHPARTLSFRPHQHGGRLPASVQLHTLSELMSARIEPSMPPSGAQMPAQMAQVLKESFPMCASADTGASYAVETATPPKIVPHALFPVTEQTPATVTFIPAHTDMPKLHLASGSPSSSPLRRTSSTLRIIGALQQKHPPGALLCPVFCLRSSRLYLV